MQGVGESIEKFMTKILFFREANFELSSEKCVKMHLNKNYFFYHDFMKKGHTKWSINGPENIL